MVAGQVLHVCGFVSPVTASLVDSEGRWVVMVNVSGKGLASESGSFHASVFSKD